MENIQTIRFFLNTKLSRVIEFWLLDPPRRAVISVKLASWELHDFQQSERCEGTSTTYYREVFNFLFSTGFAQT